MKIDKCPKCGSKKIIQSSRYPETGHHFLQQEYFYECLNCGWGKWSNEIKKENKRRVK